MAVRRITNPIRFCSAASLLIHDEVRKAPFTLLVACESDERACRMVGSGTPGRRSEVSGETCT